MHTVSRYYPSSAMFSTELEPGDWPTWKKHLVAIMGEFVGTVLFLWIALAGTSFANIPETSASGDRNTTNVSNVLFVALSFGFSLAINAWIFFRISGGLFNPAITFGLVLVGAVPLVRGCLLIVTQLVGGIIAALLVFYMFPTPLLAETTLHAGTSVVQGLFIEAFLTFELIMAIFMLAAEKSKATFIAPIGIGLAFFVAELVGVYYTGGSLNPARSLGPAVMNNSFPEYHWIYWIGPLLGTLLASGFYMLLKLMDYHTVLPDQDTDKAPEGKAALARPAADSAAQEPIGGRSKGAEETKTAPAVVTYTYV